MQKCTCDLITQFNKKSRLIACNAPWTQRIEYAPGRKIPGQRVAIQEKQADAQQKAWNKHRRGHGAAIFSHMAMGPGDAAGMGPGDAAAATSRIVAASTAAPRIHVI